jgi:hypothetical protein
MLLARNSYGFILNGHFTGNAEQQDRMMCTRFAGLPYRSSGGSCTRANDLSGVTQGAVRTWRTLPLEAVITLVYSWKHYEGCQVQKNRCHYLPYCTDVSHSCSDHGALPSLSHGITEVKLEMSTPAMTNGELMDKP